MHAGEPPRGLSTSELPKQGEEDFLGKELANRQHCSDQILVARVRPARNRPGWVEVNDRINPPSRGRGSECVGAEERRWGRPRAEP